MISFIIALGSNWQQTAHIEWASQRLSSMFSGLRLSRKLWTHDIHGTGILYMNRLAAGTTSLTIDELTATLKALEAETGRSHEHVTIDLDLMQYGEQRCHERDWPRPYIQQLIPDIL